jgi:hypothetical protein
MNAKRHTAAPATPADVVREYGPFADAGDIHGTIHGVTHDGRHVWAATGTALLAIDPASGAVAQTLARACDAGTAFDGTHLYQIAEARIDKIDPTSGRVLASIPAPGHGRDSGLAWAEGSLWVGQYPRPQDPPHRPGHRRDPAHHRVRPLRDRRDLGRRRVVARHLGWRRQRHPPCRPPHRRCARAAGHAAWHRCQRPGIRWRRALLLWRRAQRRGACSAQAEAGMLRHTARRRRWTSRLGRRRGARRNLSPAGAASVRGLRAATPFRRHCS